MVSMQQRGGSHIFILRWATLLVISKQAQARNQQNRNPGQFNTNLEASKSAYTQNFNEWANKQSLNTNLMTKKFFIGLLTIK
jgi:hypothetical protein